MQNFVAFSAYMNFKKMKWLFELLFDVLFISDKFGLAQTDHAQTGHAQSSSTDQGTF